MKHHVVVAGNIGVGKSTLVRLMEERLGWEAFYEAVVENPYLADFYRDMPRWAFHSQVFFLTRRLRSHPELVARPGVVVQDRSVYEDAEIFARNLYLQGHLAERDYQTYRDLYEALVRLLPPPDLVVYLRASVETLKARILLRGREYERGIPVEYLARLNELYEDWAARFTLAPVLCVPADRLDYVRHSHDLDLILAQVQECLRRGQLALFE